DPDAAHSRRAPAGHRDPAPGRAGRWARLAWRRHYRYRHGRPAGGHTADPGHLVVRRDLPGPGAAAFGDVRQSRNLLREQHSGADPAAVGARADPGSGTFHAAHRGPDSSGPGHRQRGWWHAVIDRPDSTERGIGIADRPAFVLLEDGEWFAGTMAA